jgi:hypothetical protein
MNNWIEKIETFFNSAKKFSNISCHNRNFFTYLPEELAINVLMAVDKKRVIKSLENLTEELRDLLREQYPNGYEGSITRITNAKREPIFVFPLETVDATYLIKVPATKNSEGEYDVESKPEDEFDNSEDADDAIPSTGYGSDDDYDEEGGGKTREASYDPDFDS